MTEWYELDYSYDPGQAKFAKFVRALYPPHDPDGPVANGPDAKAFKRAVSRLGRWPWQTFDEEYSNAFALGQGDGWDPATSGVRGVQRQAQVANASGNLGERTHDILLYARIPKGLPHAGEFAMDAQAIELLEQAAKRFPSEPPGGDGLPAGALKRKWIASPNYSSRGGSGVRLIVLHTAEGARTIEDLGHFFQGDVGASSHVGIDDSPGEIGEYVKPGNKAWTQANANPYSVSAEFCAFAKWSTAEWHNHPTMLENAARWVREESQRFGIPITKLSASQAQGGGRGVCQHVDLGAAGGGHWDCGSGLPMNEILEMARG